MNQELFDKLRRLGVQKGAKDLKPARTLKPAPPIQQPIYDEPHSQEAVPLETLLPGGTVVSTAVGSCFVLDHVYPVVGTHGNDRFADLLGFSPAPLASILDEPNFAETEFADYLFIDTETTGLAGAGVMAFMVGAAFFAEDALVVRQFFLRDHADEPAMLHLLDELAQDKTALVSFNGRSFDLPLLDNRYLMNRMFSDLVDLPHFDLLHPSRRLWRNRLGSCALQALESHLLGVNRTQTDVEGWLIPTLYRRYLETGDGREMQRVFYHNKIDMLSMVTLAARLMRQLTQPYPQDNPIDLYSLGKWYADLSQPEPAEQAFAFASKGKPSLDWYQQILLAWGALLKRNGRRGEAVPLWQQVASTTLDDVSAHIELAKFYEWHEPDLPLAKRWTEQAITLTQMWRNNARARIYDAELQHRLARLTRKIDNH